MEDNYEWCNAETTHDTCILHGLGGVEGGGKTPCRLSPPFPICNLCDPADPGYAVDPKGLELFFVGLMHIVPFITTAMVTAAFFYNLDAIKSRIGNTGCGLFNMGICFLALGSLCEFANHALIMNWNMCYDTSDNIMYLVFYVTLSLGNTLLTFGLREDGTSFLRKMTFSLDGLNALVDWILIALNLIIIPVWMAKGRVGDYYLFIPTQVVAGCFEFIRIWKNLGPQDMWSDEGRKYGILAFVMEFLSVFLSIVINGKMYVTGEQWQHGLLAICFGTNEGLLALCLLKAYPKQKVSASRGEQKSLLYIS